MDWLDSLLDVGSNVWDTVTDIGESVWDFGTDVVDTVGDIFDDFDSNDGLFKSIFGLAADLGPVLLEGYGQKEALEAILDTGNKAAEVYWANEDMLLEEAGRVEARALYEVDKVKYYGYRLIDTQRVGYLKGGVTPEGSPLMVMKETRDMINLKAQEIIEDAANKARQLRQQAEIQKKQAQIALSAADSKGKQLIYTATANVANQLFR